jgi:hypothetical protein
LEFGKAIRLHDNYYAIQDYLGQGSNSGIDESFTIKPKYKIESVKALDLIVPQFLSLTYLKKTGPVRAHTHTSSPFATQPP